MADEPAAPAAEAAAPPATKVRFSKGVLFIMISDSIQIFGTSIRASVNTLFLYNKLRLTPQDILTINSIFQSMKHWLVPFGGFFVDLAPNKFYVIVVFYVIVASGDAVFSSLAIPGARPYTWPIIYYAETLEMLCYVGLANLLQAFSMDQFKYPDDQPMLQLYINYINVISRTLAIVGALISPLLKTRIPCLGEQDCYIIPYGIFMFFTLIRIVVFFFGKKFYIVKKPVKKNVKNVFPCIWYGFVQSIKERKTNPQPHWMDHAIPKYGEEVVEEAKALLRMFFMDLRLPFLHAINAPLSILIHVVQIRLKLRLGTYKLIPDHLVLVFPIISVVTWALLARFVEPWIKKTKMARPLRRMSVGISTGIFMCVFYGVIATLVMENMPVLPKAKEGQLRIINGADCACVVTMSKFINESIEVGAHGMHANLHVPLEGYQTFSLTVHGSCFEASSGTAYLVEKEAVTVYIRPAEDNTVIIDSYTETISRDAQLTLPLISVLGAEQTDKITLVDSRGVEVVLPPKLRVVAGAIQVTGAPRTFEALPDWYKLYRNDRVVIEFETDLGGIYHITLAGDAASLKLLANPNNIHFLWVIPGIIIDTFGSYMISLANADFIYPETPPSLRGTTFAMRNILIGTGAMMIKLFSAFDVALNVNILFYGSLKVVLLTFYILSGKRIRSRFPDRKLI